MKLAASAAVAIALLFAGCGSSGHFDARGRTLLDAQIAAARQAAARGDMVRAGVLVQAVEDTVNSLRARDWIDDRHAAAILAAVGETQDALRRYSTTGTTGAPAATPTTLAPAPPRDSQTPSPKKHGHGKGGE